MSERATNFKMNAPLIHIGNKIDAETLSGIIAILQSDCDESTKQVALKTLRIVGTVKGPENVTISGSTLTAGPSK